MCCTACLHLGNHAVCSVAHDAPCFDHVLPLQVRHFVKVCTPIGEDPESAWEQAVNGYELIVEDLAPTAGGGIGADLQLDPDDEFGLAAGLVDYWQQFWELEVSRQGSNCRVTVSVELSMATVEEIEDAD